MFFDALAVQVNGPRAWDEHITVDVAFTDDGSRYRVQLARGVLTHRRGATTSGADVTVTLPHHSQLVALVGGGLSPAAMREAGIALSGDLSALERLVAVLDPGDPDFAIVTADKE